MSQSIARTLLDELRADEGLRRELALELASEIIRHRNARLVLAQAILREVATKDDIESLRKEFKSDIEGLRKEFKDGIESLRKEFKDELRERVGVVEGKIKTLEDRIKTLEDSVKALEIRLAKLESSHTLFTRLFIAFNIPILIGIIGTLLTIIWRGVP